MRIALLLGLVIGCGDNLGPGSGDDDLPPCEPTPGALPTMGKFVDPYELELPDDCVAGGLRDFAGRWFVVDPQELFSFEYPKFEGSCDAGFRRFNYADEDHDETDGFSFYSWTDGTRFYNRFAGSFPRNPPDPPFEFASAFVACMRPDDTLAAVRAQFDTDRDVRTHVQVGTRFGVKDAPAEGLALVGEVAQYGPNFENRIVGYNVWVDGTHAYLVGPNGLDIADVTDPAQPTVVGHLDGGYNDVRVVNRGGKVVAYLSPLDFVETTIADVTDPANPTIAGSIPEYSHSVQIVETATVHELYLATYTDQVPRYNTTNLLTPARLGSATVPGDPMAGIHDLTVDGDRIYANDTTSGFVALDVSGGLGSGVDKGHIATSYSHASWVGTTASGRRVILHGDEGMTKTPELGAFLRILEGDPASPNYMTVIGTFRTRHEVGIHNIELVGDRVYLSYYQDGIRIVDIADPTQPHEVAHFNTWDPETSRGDAFEGAVGVRPIGGLVYVADIDRGLIILREP